MPVPTYDKFMLPLLRLAGDGKEHHIRDAIIRLADEFQLSEAERAEMLPSGKKSTVDDRVQWANTYLKKAGLLRSVKRGVFQITDEGRNVLVSNPSLIDRDYLMRFQSFVEFQTPVSSEHLPRTIKSTKEGTDQTPQEQLQNSYQRLRDELAQELLEQIATCSPSFFERLVVDLLLAMGYGGAIEGAGRIVGRSGDGGIDGIISEDKLGFDVIYVQAKRWDTDSVVGRPTVQAFAGSLIGQGVTKGTLITTSRFSRDAVEFAETTKHLKIVLIDGQQLTQLLIEHNIGVSPVETFVLKKIDSDYFDLV